MEKSDNFINYIKFQYKKCFKNLYISADNKRRQKIDNLILKHLSFHKYFKYEVNYYNIDHKFSGISKIKNNIKKNWEKIFEKEKTIKIIVNKLKKENKSFFEKCYISQKGHSLLLVSIMANHKIKEKGFLEELENNYGVYLEADKFINEIKHKLNEIKNYYDLYKYIGCTLLQSDDLNNEIELIADAYNIAVNKGYITK